MNKPIVTLTTFLVAAGFLTLVNNRGPSDVAQAEKIDGDCYNMVAPLDDVMEVVETLFYDMEKKLLKAEKIKFKTVRRQSNLMAEVMNLATQIDLDDYIDKDENYVEKNKKWKRYAETARNNLLKMAKATKAKKPDEIKALWKTVEKACDSCHEDIRDD